jgi:two-component system alkaline phosphatase synthesis response regulator PhoP
MSKIFVAEDDRFLATAYRAKLSKAGFDVTILGNGQEMLDALVKDVPDLILLDLVMPLKDGFTALEEIRAQDKLKSVPIIVTSNLGQQEDLDKAKALGANDYVIKSDLSMDALVTKVKTALGQA